MSFGEQRRIPSVWILIGLSLFLFFFRLGDRSFRNPDEGRYAEIAREMVLSGDWVEPRLYGIDYLRKPPLFYWLVGGSFKFFGFSEWAARAVPALFGLLGVLATYFFTRCFFGTRSAVFSGFLLATNLWYLNVGRYLLTDMVFSFFVVGTLYLFFAGTREENGSKKEGLFFRLAFLSMALAFLTKGLAGVAIPSAGVFFYLLLTGEFRNRFWRKLLFSGVALFLAIVLPWFVFISQREKEFLSFFFMHEHFKRFFSKDFEHQAGWYFYFWVLPVVFLPWILFPAPLKKSFEFLKKRSQDRPRFFLMVSALSTVLFYTFSRSKLPTYILPAVMLLSILIADGWSCWGHPRAQALFATIIVIFSVTSLVVTVAMEKMNGNYTTRSFADALKHRLKESEGQIFIYDHPGAFYDFEFYLGRPVKLVGLEGEFELSRGDEEARSASVTHEEFKKILNGPESIYCLMRKSDYLGWDPADRERVHVLKEDQRKVLVTS